MKNMKCENCGTEWGVDDNTTNMILCPNCIKTEMEKDKMSDDNLVKLKKHIENKLISEFVEDLMSDVSCLELAKKGRKKQK